MQDQLTKEIISAAYAVHRTLGFGYLEKVYENALMIELQKRGILAAQQKSVIVYYDKQIVGDFRADIIVDEKVILEIKAVSQMIKRDEVQLVNYLKAMDKPYGLLINFGEKLEVKRKYRDYRPGGSLQRMISSIIGFMPF